MSKKSDVFEAIEELQKQIDDIKNGVNFPKIQIPDYDKKTADIPEDATPEEVEEKLSEITGLTWSYAPESGNGHSEYIAFLSKNIQLHYVEIDEGNPKVLYGSKYMTSHNEVIEGDVEHAFMRLTRDIKEQFREELKHELKLEQSSVREMCELHSIKFGEDII